MVCVIVNHSISAQSSSLDTILVSGTVVDSEGNPIKGALVYVDSVKTRIKTNRYGKFKIWLKPETMVVSVFFRKNGIYTLKFDGANTLNFVFPEENKIISEDSLETLGYTDDKPSKNKKKSKDYSKYRDVYQMLVAEIPGVQVVGSMVYLRGTSRASINAGLSPLFIVDGTPVSSIDFIMPNEIESLKVLRDESASIYGVRAANGVIVINLKK